MGRERRVEKENEFTSGTERCENISKLYVSKVIIMPDYDICTRNKSETIKNREMLKANEMKVLRKTASKTKIDIITSQQIRESCDIQPINE